MEQNFQEFEGSWDINQVGDTILFAGISKQERRKQLQEMEYSHMAKFPREMLLNDFFGSSPSIAAETKRQQTIKDYSVEEAEIVKQRRIEGHKSRGSVFFRRQINKWTFQWPKQQQSKSFETQEAALAFQQTIFPQVALPPDPSYVYLIFHPDQTKVYIGQTTQSLSDRMRLHRTNARKGGNEFYLLMKTTLPLTWEIKAIHILYGVSDEERRAVELFCLRQYQPSELFNTNLNIGGMSMVPSWSFSYYVSGRKHSKSFCETQTRSLQQAEVEAKECQRKHIEAATGGNGWVSLQKRFDTYGPFGGKPRRRKIFNMTRSVSEEQAKAAAEQWLAEMRIKEDIRNERIAKAAIEKSASLHNLKVNK